VTGTCVFWRSAALAGLLIASGCAGAPRPYADGLEQALAAYPGANPPPAGAVNAFVELFSEFDAPDWRARAEARYAPALYFSDTLTVAHSREQLLDYFEQLRAGDPTLSVRVDAVVQHGADVYVRWRMAMRFRAAGRDIDSRSIGMTLLRFDEAGLIVLHQDYWDSAEGLYRHLPVIGGLIGWIGRRIHGT
jgi:predicted SnoaL-like aldol condensation-catalyzing enzyme